MIKKYFREVAEERKSERFGKICYCCDEKVNPKKHFIYCEKHLKRCKGDYNPMMEYNKKWEQRWKKEGQMKL